MCNYKNLFSAAAIVVSLLFSIKCVSQNRRIDSLKIAFKSVNKSDRVEIMIRLGTQHMKYDKELSLKYLKSADSLAFAIKDTAKIVRAGRVRGEVLRIYEKNDEAIGVLSGVLPLARESNSEELKYILNSLGIIYTVEANYTRALEFQLESLDIRRNNSDSSEISIGLSSIGFVYYKLRNYKKALTYFINSLEVKKKINDNFGLEALVNNISLCYANLKAFEEARNYIEKGMVLCGEECDDEFFIHANYCRGLIAYGENKIEDAEEYFTLSLINARKNNNIRFQFDNIENLAQIYLSQNRIQEAFTRLKEAEELIKGKPPYNLEMIKIYKRFYELFSRTKNFPQLAHYQDRYIHLKDSIYNEEFTNNLLRIEAKFIERDNERKLTAQNQTMLLQKEEMKRQRLLNIFMGCMTVMLVLLAFILIRANRQKREINKLLDEKVKQRTRELQEGYNAMLGSNEERNLVADRTSLDIKSSVLTLKGLCSVAIHELKDERANEYISKMSLTTDQIMEELKRFQNLTQLSIRGDAKKRNT